MMFIPAGSSSKSDSSQSMRLILTGMFPGPMTTSPGPRSPASTRSLLMMSLSSSGSCSSLVSSSSVSSKSSSKSGSSESGVPSPSSSSMLLFSSSKSSTVPTSSPLLTFSIRFAIALSAASVFGLGFLSMKSLAAASASSGVSKRVSSIPSLKAFSLQL